MTSRAIRLVKQVLDELVDGRFIENRSGVTVPASSPGGFDATFSENFHEYTVRLGDWECHFIRSNLDDAVNCFSYALTHPTRVKIFSRHGVRYKWQLQFREGGEWRNYTACQKFAYPYLGKLTLEYQENRPLEELAA